MFREIDRLRSKNDASGHMVDYTPYEEKLTELNNELKGDLLDIEMALQQALESAKASFFAQVKTINEDIGKEQIDTTSAVNLELQVFSQKLKEELNRERESFV